MINEWRHSISLCNEKGLLLCKICLCPGLRVDFVPLSENGEITHERNGHWQPSASIPNLLKRAAIMAEIRRFFADRGVTEVETPCMSQATVTDIHLVPFETRFVGQATLRA